MEKLRIGYARCSTKKQKLDSQIKALEEMNVELDHIYTDQFTGTGKANKREGWNALKKAITKKYKGKNVTICFLSVNRMSRNEEEGVKEYFELLDLGCNIEFKMEPMINSSVYGDKIRTVDSISVDDELLDSTILDGVRKYMVELAKEQIKIAFRQAQMEAEHIKYKVKRGIKSSEKKSGRPKGYVSTKKAAIPNNFKAKVSGGMNVTDLAEIFKVSRTTIYNWKKELSL